MAQDFDRWLEKLVAQNPTFLRGVPESAAGVADGKYLATPAAAGDPRPKRHPRTSPHPAG
ncbi:hypothetical protein [Kribbella antiqua]|uniref:hypothetical protein n=1 Tax=Kribbella antiqua TaxID=2512217 RepID=UPI00104A28DA|nr:hypothetical protein [Kribbella antiqua]